MAVIQQGILHATMSLGSYLEMLVLKTQTSRQGDGIIAWSKARTLGPLERWIRGLQSRHVLSCLCCVFFRK
jgi:hypothetical protein